LRLGCRRNCKKIALKKYASIVEDNKLELNYESQNSQPVANITGARTTKRSALLASSLDVTI